MSTLLIATRNAHKVAEIQSILGPTVNCCALSVFSDAPTAIEDADSFAGNALKKAHTIATWLNTIASLTRIDFVLADDSGLEVDALDGAPGIHSARFAALDLHTGNSSDADNNAKLLRLLHEIPKERRSARFHCAIALFPMAMTSTPLVFEGTCEGWIDFAPRGKGGFGYDPLFIPAGYSESFAELGEDVKSRISHRAMALAKLSAALGKDGALTVP